MFKWQLFGLSRPLDSRCFDGPGADGGGGGAAAGDPSAGTTGDAGDGDPGDGQGDGGGGDGGGDDQGGDARSAGAEGDPDADDDTLLFGDDEGEGKPLEEQVRALRQRARKLARRYAKVKPIADRFRGEDGRIVDVDDFIAARRRLTDLEARAERDPRMRALLDGREDPPARRDEGPTRRPFAMTTENLGFDPRETRANAVIADTVRRVQEMGDVAQTIRALQEKVDGLVGDTTRRQTQADNREWSTETARVLDIVKRAAPTNTFLQTVIKDALYGAKATAKEHGRTPREIAEHYLARARNSGLISNQVKGAVTAGLKQRMAEQNRKLPRQDSGGGAPARPGGDKRITLADVHRRVRSGAAFAGRS